MAVFVFSLAVYLASLPRTVSFEDSAEFVTAAATLGVPHPSGFPLYVLLARLFVWLPFGTIPWRVAFFSAVCAAAAAALVFVLARRLAASWGVVQTPLVRLAMFAVAAMLAVSEIWWSQAIYAKVYALHVLLLLAACWALLRFSADVSRDRWLAAAVFLFGLACSNHLFLSLAFAPFFAGAPLAADRRLLRPSRRWLLFAAALAAGWLPYLYLPLRAAMNPPYAFGRIVDWRDLAAYVLRSRYGDFDPGAWKTAGLSFALLGQLLLYLGPLPVFLAAVGAVGLYRRKDPAARAGLILCLGGIFSAPLALLLRPVPWTEYSAYAARVYGLAGYAFTAVLAAAGFAWLLRDRLNSRGRLVRPAAAVLLLLLPLAVLVSDWPKTAPYRSGFVEDYGRKLLASLPPDAVLLVNDFAFNQDTELFTLAYLQTVEKLRADVTIVQDVGISCFRTPDLPAGYASQTLDQRRRLLLTAALDQPDLADRPLFATFPPEYVMKGLTADSNGLVFRLLPEGAPAALALPAVELPALPDGAMLRRQPALGSLVSRVLYNYAASQVEEQGSRAGTAALIEAVELDLGPMSADYRAFLAHRSAVAPAPPR